MCGVIGLVAGREREDLGRMGADLLRALEYRGYDSTGAAIQGPGTDVWLRKGVGAPSVMVERLGIVSRGGQLFCGQVRWATFGAVDEANAQPHDVTCHTHIYGAHNGNVTNCDDLKAWLTGAGHRVLSDNDGEMVLHAVEHFFAEGLAALPEARRLDHSARKIAMRSAIGKAANRLVGSFAAVIMDPVTRCAWSIKQGSSLFFGVGRAAASADSFTVSSSDLSAVLRLTRWLVPLSPGEFVEHEASRFSVHRLDEPQSVVERRPVRSRLRAQDTALSSRFSSYMEQEIAAQEATCREVVDLMAGGRALLKRLATCLSTANIPDWTSWLETLDALHVDGDGDDTLRTRFTSLVDSTSFQTLLKVAGQDQTVAAALAIDVLTPLAERFVSIEAGLLADLAGWVRNDQDQRSLLLLDLLAEHRDAIAFNQAVDRFVELCRQTRERGGRLFALCCGSSFHAAKAAAGFFDELASTTLTPLLPGELRGQVLKSLDERDLVVAISQSGETKDIIDVLDEIATMGKRLTRVSIVNVVGSTLGMEKSDLTIPLRCGPEVAVPATKSFMNQLAVLYGLALRLGESTADDDKTRKVLAAHREKFATLPKLVHDTLEKTEESVNQAAEMLYLAPSLHVLGIRMPAIAKEGALKVREVVLNHAEGFEGSEFKHGPNTILGFNTVLGPAQVEALCAWLGRAATTLVKDAAAAGFDAASQTRLANALTTAFSPVTGPTLSDKERAFLEKVIDRPHLRELMTAEYPLIYLTGPDARDVALTVSQINTHKIRGALTVVIAEEHPDLRQAAVKPPAGRATYRSVYIALPTTGDRLLTTFSTTVVLQRLALTMSLMKARYLDHLGIREHGVHPDVPKNVSKSLTVD